MMDLLTPIFGISPAYAQDGGAGAIIQLLPLIAIFGVFYFILIRPQQKKQKEHRVMLEALQRGDKVVTGGGIVGTVIKIEPGKEEMFVEIAPNVRVTVLRSTLTAKFDPNAAAAAAQAAARPANDAKPDGKAEAKPDAKAEPEKQG